MIRRRNRTFLIAATLLAIAGPGAAQDIPVARNDVFSTLVDSVLSVDQPGVLENDSSSTMLRALLIENPSHGNLTFHSDGSFIYRPRAGFTGVDRFIYAAQHDGPLTFDIDEKTSTVRLSARISTTIGTESDSDTSRLDGFVEARLYPDSEPFTELQITSFELRLIDAIHLNFDFGFLAGELDVYGASDSVLLRLDEPGVAVDVDDGDFVQAGNYLLLNGRLDVEANRAIGTFIDDGPQTLDIRTPADLQGNVREAGSEVVLSMPLEIPGTFEVAGNEVEVTIVGSVSATASPSPRITSNEAVVTLVVGTVATGVGRNPMASDILGPVRNYPNPFHGSTRVVFELGKPGDISLAIYDALGRRIETLSDGHHAAGQHTIIFDANHLAPGIYLCMLYSGESLRTGILIIR